MAGVAQLVRASVCGTECRQFESGHPPHKIKPHQNGGVKFYQDVQPDSRNGRSQFDPQVRGRLKYAGEQSERTKGVKRSGTIWSPAQTGGVFYNLIII